MSARCSDLYRVTMLASLALFSAGHLLNPVTAFFSIALAALVASVPFLSRFRSRRFEQQTVPFREALASNWAYGRWLLATALLYPLSVQIQIFVLAGSVGLSAAGILRAVQLPSVAMTQAIAAIGMLELPALAHAFGTGDLHALQKKGNRITLLLMLVATGYEVVLLFANQSIEHVLYGGKFTSDCWLIAGFGAAPVFAAFLT